MDFDAARVSLPVERLGFLIHAFGSPEAIALSRAVGYPPGRFVVIGVEGKNVEPGCGLSPSIRKTVDAVADRPGTELRTGLEPGWELGVDGVRGVGGRHSERSI